MSNTHTPSFFELDRFEQLYLPRHAEIAREAAALRGEVRPASQDATRVAVFGIDCQVGFSTPGASLFVPGAVGDMQRGARFILDNLERITTLIFSLDTHRAYQIFHPAFWSDADGEMPPPMTVITSDDVRGGRWLPIRDVERVIAYCELLEATGRYVLTVWPYHTLLGSPDHALVPALFEVAHYHSVARQTQTRLFTKGEHPMTENYSVLEPEVKEIDGWQVGGFNTELFELLMTHDTVYVWGEASSHCVSATLQSLQTRLEATAPALMERIVILSDCMSPVPPVCDASGAPLPGLDFPTIAQERLQGFSEAGMRLTTAAEAAS